MHGSDGLGTGSGSLAQEVQAEQDKDARSLSLIPGPWGNTGAALRHMPHSQLLLSVRSVRKRTEDMVSDMVDGALLRLSDIIGPLDQCHYRRGDCWLTVAEYGKAAGATVAVAMVSQPHR